MTDLAPSQRAYEIADSAWCRELYALFGFGWLDARWTHLGKGRPGSRLRDLFDAREVASEAFNLADREYRSAP